MTGACALCQICYYQCPQVEFQGADAEAYAYGRQRSDAEQLGVVRGMFVGRALNEAILKNAQDGGAVSAILSYMLDEKLIGAAVVTSRDSMWKPQPVVVTDSSKLSEVAGTKYTTSPTLLGVESAVSDYGKTAVAMVGTPCQVRAVRRIQTSPFGNRRLAEAVRMVIGLFCMESYSYDKLFGGFLALKGIDPSAVARTSIKKGSFIVVDPNGIELLHVPLREIGSFVRQSCWQCTDFTAEYADISVGGVGCPAGYSTIVVRSEGGERMVREAVAAGYLEVKELAPESKGSLKVLNMTHAKRQRVTGSSSGSP